MGKTPALAPTLTAVCTLNHIPIEYAKYASKGRSFRRAKFPITIAFITINSMIAKTVITPANPNSSAKIAMIKSV